MRATGYFLRFWIESPRKDEMGDRYLEQRVVHSNAFQILLLLQLSPSLSSLILRCPSLHHVVDSESSWSWSHSNWGITRSGFSVRLWKESLHPLHLLE